uniref:Uncharacterized protein n=1 Tax=viral metagenome TaxID=1070528 RepID=A0A6C0KH39_9ZZZZ
MIIHIFILSEYKESPMSSIFVKTLAGDLLPIDLPQNYRTEHFGHALRRSICQKYSGYLPENTDPTQISLFRSFPKRAGFSNNLKGIKPGDTICMFLKEPHNTVLVKIEYPFFRYSFSDADVKVCFEYNVVEKRYMYQKQLFSSVEKMITHLEKSGVVSCQNASDFNHIWWVYN